MEMEITSFIAEVRESGGSIEVTIPHEVVKFEGLQKGDIVKLLVKKMKKE